MSTTERMRTSARRESLLGDQPGAFASARYQRITPMKARRVVDMVRGLPVDEALALSQRSYRICLPRLHRLRAEILARTPGAAKGEALAELVRAIEVAGVQGAKAFAAEAAEVMAGIEAAPAQDAATA